MKAVSETPTQSTTTPSAPLAKHITKLGKSIQRRIQQLVGKPTIEQTQETPRYQQTSEERELLSHYKQTLKQMESTFSSLGRRSTPINNDALESLHRETITINEKRIHTAENIIVAALAIREEAVQKGYLSLIREIDQDITTMETVQREATQRIKDAKNKLRRKTADSDQYDPDLDTP